MTSERPGSRRVFVDTGAYYGFADADDAVHLAALDIARRLATERRPLFTTNFVLAETHALCLARLGRDVAFNVLQDILHSASTTIVRVSAADERHAQALIAQHSDKRYSYADATSFAVMQRLRIGEAFTFDRNFSQFGLTVLQP